MRDLLFEIGVEELPARFVLPASKQLVKELEDRIHLARLGFSVCIPFSTPRRLAVWVKDVSIQQEDLTEEIKGPPKKIAVDKGTLLKPGVGFLKSQGVTEDAMFFKEVGGVEYLFVRKFHQGRQAKEVLGELLPEVIKALHFPKNMRWGDLEFRYARPLRWIVALFGTEVVEFSFAGVASSHKTRGHRQLAPGPFVLTKPSQYEEQLESYYVVADSAKRSSRIKAQVEDVVRAVGGEVLFDEKLLTEVTNLVEYPTAFLGSFSATYLQVPKEVLITSMMVHQRYFPVVDEKGALLPYFVGVRNGSLNHLDKVQRGNEKVLTARLADATFFFEEDKKSTLEEQGEKLKNVVFQEGLGHLQEKVERITRLAHTISGMLGILDTEAMTKTARLCKSDLVSLVVYEFPELQGIMGSYYAAFQGEQESVVEGIREHYYPRFAQDSLPMSLPGMVVSLADKMDTLVGYFGLGKIPTGSNDPFALRRQALGIVQILAKKNLALSLSELIGRAYLGYACLPKEEEEVQRTLKEFMGARLRVVLQEEGFRYDTIDAVFAEGFDQVPRTLKRAKALHGYREKEEFLGVYSTYLRAANLAQKGTKNDIQEELLLEAEKALYGAIKKAEEQRALLREDFSGILACMGELKTPVDDFFEAVMVMDEDEAIRENRLALLRRVAALLTGVADLRLVVMDS